MTLPILSKLTDFLATKEGADFLILDNVAHKAAVWKVFCYQEAMSSIVSKGRLELEEVVDKLFKENKELLAKRIDPSRRKSIDYLVNESRDINIMDSGLTLEASLFLDDLKAGANSFISELNPSYVNYSFGYHGGLSIGKTRFCFCRGNGFNIPYMSDVNSNSIDLNDPIFKITMDDLLADGFVEALAKHNIEIEAVSSPIVLLYFFISIVTDERFPELLKQGPIKASYRNMLQKHVTEDRLIFDHCDNLNTVVTLEFINLFN